MATSFQARAFSKSKQQEEDKKIEEAPVTPMTSIPQAPVQDIPNTRVNPDGSITKTIGGKVFNLTAEEWASRSPNHPRANVQSLNASALNRAEQAWQLGQVQTDPAILAQQMAQVGTLTPEQQAKNVVQGEGAVAGISTGAAALAGGISGAGVGAGIGAAVGSVIPIAGTAAGAVAGGIIGGAVGAIGGAFTKITAQKRQDVKTAYAVFVQSKSNLDWIINQVNAKKMSNSVAIDMWDEELANFYSAERNLRNDTDSNLDRFLSGGSDEMAKLEAFKRRLPFKTQLLYAAMTQPNPANVILTENTDLELT